MGVTVGVEALKPTDDGDMDIFSSIDIRFICIELLHLHGKFFNGYDMYIS